MRKLNLCIDIDGTITEAYDWIPRVNNYFGTSITAEDAIYYEIHKVLDVDPIAYKMFYNLYGELLHHEPRPRKNAKNVLTNLYSNHNIHFVTAREDRMKSTTYMWLLHHEIPIDSLTLLGSHHKVDTAKVLECDIFLEDRYENAIELSTAGFKVLLVDCNYNKGPLPANVTRVNNWLEIEKIINHYAEEQSKSYKIA